MLKIDYSRNRYTIEQNPYFNDKLMQMEHESKGYLSDIIVDVLGTKYNLSIYTPYRFMQDIEADLESKDVIIFLDEYNPHTLFVKTLTIENVLNTIDIFAREKSI